MASNYEDIVEIPILLLGDAGVGKSMFLSYVYLSLTRFQLASWTPQSLDESLMLHIQALDTRIGRFTV